MVRGERKGFFRGFKCLSQQANKRKKINLRKIVQYEEKQGTGAKLTN